jgi:hypothetical protein
MGLLAFVAVLALGVQVVSSYRIYALSNQLDVRVGGSWNEIPLTFGNITGRYFVDFLGAQLGIDKTDNLYVTALNGVEGQRPFVTTNKWETVNNTLVASSFYIGRFGFDSNNNFYSVNRFNPAGSVRSPIVKIPSSNYSDDTSPDRFIGWAEGTTDITSFRNGTAMVVVGNFTQISFSSNVSDTTGTPANRVALYNVRTGTWSAMGNGLPETPSRIVSDASGTRLVAWAGSTLWRWNGTSAVWNRFDLNLTTRNPEEPGSITDLAFGGSKLFVLGNFFRMNGVGARNVSLLTFRNTGSLGVVGIGIGLPGGEPKTLFARSSVQIFVGGSTKGLKTVYEWRLNRDIPWDRVGSLGFSNGTSPVVALTVLE